MVRYTYNEISSAWNKYHQGHIIRQYINQWDNTLPIPLMVKHSTYERGIPYEFIDSPLNHYWCSSNNMYDLMRQKTGAQYLWRLGHPIVYIDLPKPSRRKGTLIMPCHPTRTIEIHYDWDQYLDRFTVLPEQFHPISISLTDHKYGPNGISLIERIEHKCIERNIQPVVYCENQSFLESRCTVLSNHEFTTANYEGAIPWLSTYCGCKFFYYGDPPTYECNNRRWTPDFFHKDIFSFNHAHGYENKMALMKSYLGFHFKRSPDALLSIFKYCAMDKQYSNS